MDHKRLHSSICTIDKLPDDVLLHILSYLNNLAEVARTSILSRRWRNVWRRTTSLNFDATSMPNEDILEQSHEWYVVWVNKVINDRVQLPQFTHVKELQILYNLDATYGNHIDKWINFAIANKVETLQLELFHHGVLIPSIFQFKLTEEYWYRAPSGLSSIKFLKTLVLSCVNVSKQFIEFILSSCPHLEHLSLYCAGTFSDLDISGSPPLRLKRLVIDAAEDYAVTKLCAPYLTSFYYNSKKFEPQMIFTPMLTDLTIGGTLRSQPMMRYLEPFWSYLPQLEKLDLFNQAAKRFKLKPIPELVNLKYLKIKVNRDTDPTFFRIIDFMRACPLLETFGLEILFGDTIRKRKSTQLQERIKKSWRKVDKSCSFDRLKVLELYGGYGKTIDQEVVKCIISKSPNLEKLTINTEYSFKNGYFPPSIPKTVKVVGKKAKKLCHRCPLEIKIMVL